MGLLDRFISIFTGSPSTAPAQKSMYTRWADGFTVTITGAAGPTVAVSGQRFSRNHALPPKLFGYSSRCYMQQLNVII